MKKDFFKTFKSVRLLSVTINLYFAFKAHHIYDFSYNNLIHILLLPICQEHI